jgi:hypothetical protein
LATDALSGAVAATLGPVRLTVPTAGVYFLDAKMRGERFLRKAVVL